MKSLTLSFKETVGNPILSRILKTINNINLGMIFSKISIFILALVSAIPLYSVLINSFKNTEDIIRNPFSPFNLTLENYKYVFTSPNVPLFEMYKNTVLITFLAVFLMILVAPLAGYYIARTESKIAEVLMIYFLVGMMIPPQLTLVPLVKMFVSLKLIGTIPGLFLFYIGNNCAFAILLFSRFIKTIPYSLEESAYLDGANQFQIFWKIVFPLLKPTTATLVIFLGLHFWNDYMTPTILLSGTKTITMGITSAMGPFSSNWGLVFAFVMVATLPLLVLFLSMQDWFVKGLTAGAVK